MSASQYTIDLSSVTVANGVYVLTLMPTGSGIRDLADNAFTVAASDTWTKETFNNPPTLDDIPDPGPIDEDAVQQTITLTGISAGIGENQAIALTAQSDTLGLVDVLKSTTNQVPLPLRYYSHQFLTHGVQQRLPSLSKTQDLTVT